MPFIPVMQTQYRSLYHYQPYSGERKLHLEITLRDHTIYLSQPQSFNDPWDCKPCLDLDALDNPMIRDAHIEYFMLRTPHLTREAFAIEMQRKPTLLRCIVEQSSDGLCRTINDEYRIYCLTSKDDNALMWAHYADKHTGICLQFDARTFPIDSAYKVAYQLNLPKSSLIENDDEQTIQALFTKSDEWGYEDEFRLLARDESAPLPDIPITKNNLLKLADRVLIGIIVGCQSDAGDEIVELVCKYQPAITVKKAVRAPRRYGLTFDTLYAGR